MDGEASAPVRARDGDRRAFPAPPRRTRRDDSRAALRAGVDPRPVLPRAEIQQDLPFALRFPRRREKPGTDHGFQFKTAVKPWSVPGFSTESQPARPAEAEPEVDVDRGHR